MSNTTPEGKKTSITAEEILNKYGFIDGYSIHSNTEDSRKNLLAAIEYALTSSDKDAEIANLKKELDIETDSAIKWQLDHCRLAEQYEWLQRQIADASEKAHGSSGMCCQLRYNEKRLRESCEKALEERDSKYKRLETVRWTEVKATEGIVKSLESEIERLQKEKEDSQKFQKESRIKRKAEKKALVESIKIQREALEWSHKSLKSMSEGNRVMNLDEVLANSESALSTVSKEKEG